MCIFNNKKHNNIFYSIVTFTMLLSNNFVTNNIYAKEIKTITNENNSNFVNFEKVKQKNYVDYIKDFNSNDCEIIEKYQFRNNDDCFIPLSFLELNKEDISYEKIVNEEKDCTTKSNIEKQKLKEELEKKKHWDGSYSYEYLGIPIFITDGNCYQYVEQLKNEMSKIPPQLLVKLANKGWTITITTDNLAETVFLYFYTSVYAYTDFDIKSLYVEDRIDAIKNATIHELGHALDKELNWPSYSQDFINRFNMDYSGFDYLTPNYKEWQTDKLEVFAEAFYLCYSNPKTFQQYCPNMYDFIINIQ